MCKDLENFPRLSKVSWTFNDHGSRPGRPEHQNQMRQTELCFQVQTDLVLLFLQGGTCTWCPPSIRVQERVVGHVSRWVGALGAEVRCHRKVGASDVMEGAVPTAAWEGEEGPADSQVPYGWTTGMVHTSGNWCGGRWRVSESFIRLTAEENYYLKKIRAFFKSVLLYLVKEKPLKKHWHHGQNLWIFNLPDHCATAVCSYVTQNPALSPLDSIKTLRLLVMAATLSNLSAPGMIFTFKTQTSR